LIYHSLYFLRAWFPEYYLRREMMGRRKPAWKALAFMYLKAMRPQTHGYLYQSDTTSIYSKMGFVYLTGATYSSPMYLCALGVE
jgi:hypothetical protein